MLKDQRFTIQQLLHEMSKDEMLNYPIAHGMATHAPRSIEIYTLKLTPESPKLVVLQESKFQIIIVPGAELLDTQA